MNIVTIDTASPLMGECSVCGKSDGTVYSAKAEDGSWHRAHRDCSPLASEMT